jgi:hypothetical protein
LARLVGVDKRRFHNHHKVERTKKSIYCLAAGIATVASLLLGPVDCQRLTTTLLTSITTITTAGGRSWAALGAKTYAIVTDTMLLAAFFSL